MLDHTRHSGVEHLKAMKPVFPSHTIRNNGPSLRANNAIPQPGTQQRIKRGQSREHETRNKVSGGRYVKEITESL
jgi:hypothetical protein